mmetsp:Transcript_40965/g.83804  ORF Transcript_40965/g.83804 Transcript_40965/m.83804 type:complete len:213 (-) Transcript_40965:16-654(-)
MRDWDQGMEWRLILPFLKSFSSASTAACPLAPASRFADFPLYLSSVEAPARRRALTQSMWPCCAARHRGVSPSLDGVLRLHWASMRIWTLSAEPAWQESSRGVNPFKVTVLTLAPLTASSCTQSAFPESAAIAIGVTPPLVARSRTAPACASALMHSACPSWAAMNTGVTAFSPLGVGRSGEDSEWMLESSVPASTTAAVLTVTPETSSDLN